MVWCVVEVAGDWGVCILILFSFLIENWNWFVDEVGVLFELMKCYVVVDFVLFKKKGVWIWIIGWWDDLMLDFVEIVIKVEIDMVENIDFNFNIVFNYGGCDELIWVV